MGLSLRARSPAKRADKYAPSGTQPRHNDRDAGREQAPHTGPPPAWTTPTGASNGGRQTPP
eukprot:4723707-Alexandrium_andersonii.AAC.1